MINEGIVYICQLTKQGGKMPVHVKLSYWMRSSMMWRIIEIRDDSIHRGARQSRLTVLQTEAVLLPGNEAASNITSNRLSIGMHLPKWLAPADLENLIGKFDETVWYSKFFYI